MKRILVVEDEPHMQMGLRDNLEFESYEVDIAGDGEAALNKISNHNYDLILLDVMIPKMSGFDVCKAARKKGVTTPIIFLTAKGEEIDKVLGLELGADDYITKPFSLRELVARVKAVLRRAEKTTGNNVPSEITIGRLKLDFQHFEAYEDGESVKLSHKEFEIINYLLEHKNQVVSRYDLLEKVWGYEAQPTTRTVDNFILKLRQKIEQNLNEPRIILTVHGVGYKLISGS
ncbi:MAG TPA: response regulator transcription factor [Cyclobacteriaceae bacterium]